MLCVWRCIWVPSAPLPTSLLYFWLILETKLEDFQQDNEPIPEGILVAKIWSFLHDTIRNTDMSYNLVDKSVVSTMTLDSGMFALTTAWSLEEKLFKNLKKTLLLQVNLDSYWAGWPTISLLRRWKPFALVFFWMRSWLPSLVSFIYYGFMSLID